MLIVKIMRRKYHGGSFGLYETIKKNAAADNRNINNYLVNILKLILKKDKL